MQRRVLEPPRTDPRASHGTATDTIDGKPLRFFHYSGHDPHGRSGCRSTSSTRTGSRSTANPPCAACCGSAATGCSASTPAADGAPTDSAAPATGLRLDLDARVAYWDAVRAAEEPRGASRRRTPSAPTAGAAARMAGRPRRVPATPVTRHLAGVWHEPRRPAGRLPGSAGRTDAAFVAWSLDWQPRAAQPTASSTRARPASRSPGCASRREPRRLHGRRVRRGSGGADRWPGWSAAPGCRCRRPRISPAEHRNAHPDTVTRSRAPARPLQHPRHQRQRTAELLLRSAL